MTDVRAVVEAVEAIAPPALAEPWDNTGLLVGSLDWPAPSALLTIDLTEAVLEDARRRGAGVIVAYHPPIFTPLERVTDADPAQRLVIAAIRSTIAIHSPHTALDAAPGGVNDWLAAGCGPGRVTALVPHADRPRGEDVKIVTFVPPKSADAVRDALSAAGAGRIGDYSSCSFESPGIGTFLGGPGTKPAVGAPGRLERVEELRLEMVAASRDVGAAVAALRAAHPYEEPPIEVHPLEARADPKRGAGRRVELEEPATLDEIAARVRRQLGVDQVRIGRAGASSRRHRVVGLCAGAGGSLLDAALAQDCDVFFTGELRYHDVLRAQARGCGVILAGHSNTERGYLTLLRKLLTLSLPKTTIAVSRKDRYPLEIV